MRMINTLEPIIINTFPRCHTTGIFSLSQMLTSALGPCRLELTFPNHTLWTDEEFLHTV